MLPIIFQMKLVGALKVGFKYNRIEIICQDYKFNKIKERLDYYEQRRQNQGG